MRGYACIGLYQPKVLENVGSVLRAAGCFGAAMVAVCGPRYSSAPTDTQKAWRHIPFLEIDDLRSVLPKECSPVAVDLVPDASPLPTFCHPERAFYIFGGEDRTLGEDVLSWCQHRIQIPTSFCLNLAAAVNIVLYDRMAKGFKP